MLCLLGSSSLSGDLVLMDMLFHFFLDWRSTFIFKKHTNTATVNPWHIYLVCKSDECELVLNCISTCAPNTSPWLCSLWRLASRTPVLQAPLGSQTTSQTQCTVSYRMWKTVSLVGLYEHNKHSSPRIGEISLCIKRKRRRREKTE